MVSIWILKSTMDYELDLDKVSDPFGPSGYRCLRPFHFICGRQGVEEGYGSSVWCPKCDVEVNREQHEIVRVGI